MTHAFFIKDSNGKRHLFLRKSTVEEDRKLAYFKRKLLEALKANEKRERAISKSLTYMEKGGARAAVGDKRKWKDNHWYRKMPDKTWKRIYDSDQERGAQMTYKRLQHAIERCTSSEELMHLVLKNKGRFFDVSGAPLPIVDELRRYINERNEELEAQAGALLRNAKYHAENVKKDERAWVKTKGEAEEAETQSTEDEENAKVQEAELKPNGTPKKGTLKVLSPKETHNFIQKHRTSKENERVSLGDIADDAKKRIKDATGLDVTRAILDSDSLHHAFNDPKHNLDDNDLDNMKEVIDTSRNIELSDKKNKQGNPVTIFKEEKPNGVILCEEYRAKNKELELQTAYKEKRLPLSAENRPLAYVRNVTTPMSSIPQDEEKSSKKDDENDKTVPRKDEIKEAYQYELDCKDIDSRITVLQRHIKEYQDKIAYTKETGWTPGNSPEVAIETQQSLIRRCNAHIAALEMIRAGKSPIRTYKPRHVVHKTPTYRDLAAQARDAMKYANVLESDRKVLLSRCKRKSNVQELIDCFNASQTEIDECFQRIYRTNLTDHHRFRLAVMDLSPTDDWVYIVHPKPFWADDPFYKLAIYRLGKKLKTRGVTMKEVMNEMGVKKSWTDAERMTKSLESHLVIYRNHFYIVRGARSA